MGIGSLAAWVVLVSAPAGTADIRKCVDAQGRVSYQSTACAAGVDEAWVRRIDSVAVPAAPAATPPARPSARDAPPARRAARVVAPRVDAGAARCDAARRRADERRDRDWNRLDFRQRSALDAEVARACRR